MPAWKKGVFDQIKVWPAWIKGLLVRIKVHFDSPTFVRWMDIVLLALIGTAISICFSSLLFKLGGWVYPILGEGFISQWPMVFWGFILSLPLLLMVAPFGGEQRFEITYASFKYPPLRLAGVIGSGLYLLFFMYAGTIFFLSWQRFQQRNRLNNRIFTG